MSFKIGDRVKFSVSHIPGTRIDITGMDGTVIMGSGSPIYIVVLNNHPEYSHIDWSFGANNLMPFTQELMHPDMELDEIHRAQEIMEGLK